MACSKTTRNGLNPVWSNKSYIGNDGNAKNKLNMAKQEMAQREMMLNSLKLLRTIDLIL